VTAAHPIGGLRATTASVAVEESVGDDGLRRQLEAKRAAAAADWEAQATARV
jgi:hypothetical protein